ncbi:MAG: hypothetical protein GW878_02965, partial [Acidobacteria bacterium]|nr:hypothetical protein [Acidobacteriota bacterium]
RDLTRDAGRPPFVCEVKDFDEHPAVGTGGSGANGERGRAMGELPLTASGATLRTYRLALAATGEYTTTVCSPNPAAVPCGLAAMVTSMNRVDGIYEREVAIRMVLIANDDLVVYT